ncbi:PREDICTED: abnormal long morphology protein 1-like isoform X7 [Bactrocera latifrons]|uniref:abnormal long morphology protein 1-like isoform X7 n=1 Tax=Bactrocera latifrons TaxID=174628 RepID=UPI0008DDCCE2|nr:PREDICTED: abnormal long morphology protein 1-like isoform X7 [Bactrocera latifrons]
MESNTKSKEMKENVESTNVMEDLPTEVEIEDCSDNSEDMDAEFSPQNKIHATETETKLVASEKQDGTEGSGAIFENDKKGDDHSLSINNVVETVIVRDRSEKDLEDNKETTNASLKLTFTATVPTEQLNGTECKSHGNEVTETIKKEIKGQDEIEFVVEEDKIDLAEDNIAENKEVKLSENAETAIALLSAKPQNSKDDVDKLQPENLLKGENTVKDIISGIDLSIEQENCELLKQQQRELLQRQQELVEQIRQQQLIAKELAAENQLRQQHLQQQEQLESPTQQETHKITSTPNPKPTPTTSQLQENTSKFLTVDKKKDEYGYTQSTQTYEYKESTNAPKNIDLLKIFTPATDANEIVPRNHYHQQQSQFKPAASPSILPAYSDAGKHRVQLNLHQEQVLEKYIKPGLKVVKTPWEAALETGSASTAFIDDVQHTQHAKTPTLSPIPVTDYKSSHHHTTNPVAYKNGFIADYSITPSHEQPQKHFPTVKPDFGHNPQRELAYKPSLAKGWKAPSPSLPKELYLPKEISLESYAPPPVITMKEPGNFKSSRGFASTMLPRTGTFPLAKPNPVEFRSYGQPNSSGQVHQETSQLVPQINYNILPLPYDKIAKFENVGEQAQNNDYNTQIRRISVKSNHSQNSNILSTSFGEKSANGEWLTTSPYHSKFPTTNINYVETSPVYTKRINPNALLHGQNYNNTARGWKSSAVCSCKSPCDNNFKAPNIGNLPYTDF